MGSGPDGSKNVKNHPFFKDIDWEKLDRKEIEPPFKPKVKSIDDTSQIDKMFTDEKPQDSLVETTLSETLQKFIIYILFLYKIFLRENNFEGFTFTAESTIDK